ncbi:MAG: hypothetical protein IPK13_01325 [Deltaproteobacteria bacterium]|nr:hypothetical protein [Deltaproteobacteria bacterium]
MSLGWKAAVIAFLAVLLIGLKIWTARRHFGAFWAEHRRRRVRVPVDPSSSPAAPRDDGPSGGAPPAAP